ncbi:unnamed protein product [Somion occarium]|uniref:Uncharacterized protein n=1 Tax=Somion occarium TaxID=3059160 RepID=A0ABP1DHS2_9APHY
MLLPLTLLFFSWGSSQVHAAQGNESCSTSTQRLQLGTYQFTSDCDTMWWCNSSNICDWKGCRRDEFPFGYWENATIPEGCPRGSFCPDEEDSCQPLLAVGSPCQLNRDDECEAPPDFQDLADNTGLGRNVNGSVCLNNVCMWANVTLGLPCAVENVPYTVYTQDTEFIDIVSRDNCRLGLYCDASQKVCMQMKELGESCQADKECQSFNCLATGVCGKPADTPSHVAFWVYIICGIAIFGGMIATLIGMFFLHKGQRDVEREKRMQYWREQNAFRQNIIQMQETARHSLMSLPMGGSQRNSMYSRDGVTSEDSQMPMLHAASKSSALRHYVSEEGLSGSEESIMMKRGDKQDLNRF